MFPTVAGKNGTASVAATSHTFPLPPNILSGRRIIVTLVMNDDTATGQGNGSMTITTSGWTALVNNAAGTRFGGEVKMRLTILTRISDGTETTISLTTANSEPVTYAGMVITDHDGTTLPAVSTPLTGAFGELPPLGPVSWGVADNLWISAIGGWPGDRWAVTPPTGYTNLVDGHIADANTSSVAMSSKNSAANTDDPDVYLYAGTTPDLIAVTIAVRPGVDGPGDLHGSFLLSGGATNSDATLSIGGTQSSSAASTNLLDDVTYVESTTGLIDYRLIYVRNDETELSVTASAFISGQLESGREVAIGLPTQAAGVTVPAIANDHTAPAGVTFSAPTTAGTGLNLGTLAPGQSRGLWVRRTVNAGTAADITNPGQISIELIRV